MHKKRSHSRQMGALSPTTFKLPSRQTKIKVKSKVLDLQVSLSVSFSNASYTKHSKGHVSFVNMGSHKREHFPVKKAYLGMCYN